MNLQEYQNYCQTQDKEMLQSDKKALSIFQRFYLQDFDREEMRMIDAEVTEALEKEIEEINGKLAKQDSTYQQTIQWHVG